MIERERAAAWVALLLGLAGWLAVLPGAAPEPGPEQCLQTCDGAVGLLFGEAMDLNAASAESLEVLPGIGPARAAAIVAARARRPFREVADLGAIRGIGPRTIEGLAGWVTVAPPLPGG